MKNKVLMLAAIFSFVISGCGVERSKYDKLKSENDSLKTELDEFKFGTKRLIAMIEKAYKEKDYSGARNNIELLNSKHPDAPENAGYKKMLKDIDQKEFEENKKIEAEEKEKNRLANLNNLGIWEINHYTNEFGEPTKEPYITNPNYIEGAFSNSATQNSKLNVTFLITNSSDISIQLYEYAGNNPVKGYSSQSYTVIIKGNDGKRFHLDAHNSSDRLRLPDYASKTLHTVLKKGGRVQFLIEEDGTPTEYHFTIDNCDGYDNAYKKLTQR